MHIYADPGPVELRRDLNFRRAILTGSIGFDSVDKRHNNRGPAFAFRSELEPYPSARTPFWSASSVRRCRQETQQPNASVGIQVEAQLEPYRDTDPSRANPTRFIDPIKVEAQKRLLEHQLPPQTINHKL